MRELAEGLEELLREVCGESAYRAYIYGKDDGGKLAREPPPPPERGLAREVSRTGVASCSERMSSSERALRTLRLPSVEEPPDCLQEPALG